MSPGQVPSRKVMVVSLLIAVANHYQPLIHYNSPLLTIIHHYQSWSIIMSHACNHCCPQLWTMWDTSYHIIPNWVCLPHTMSSGWSISSRPSPGPPQLITRVGSPPRFMFNTKSTHIRGLRRFVTLRFITQVNHVIQCNGMNLITLGHNCGSSTSNRQDASTPSCKKTSCRSWNPRWWALIRTFPCYFPPVADAFGLLLATIVKSWYAMVVTLMSLKQHEPSWWSLVFGYVPSVGHYLNVHPHYEGKWSHSPWL